MNKTFDLNRFGKYLSYDLLTSWRKAGLSVIITALLPLWFYLIYQIICLVFRGHLGQFSVFGIVAAYIVSFVIVTIAFPVRVYGFLTSKKAGSDWVLIPASAFEKFLSMLVVLCIAAPALWFGSIVACDAVMSLIPNYHGMGLTTLFNGLDSILSKLNTDNVDFVFNSPVVSYLNWSANALCFALGAVIFRKNKVVYTFLSLMAIGFIFSIAIGIIGGNPSLTSETITDDSVIRTLNTSSIVMYFVEFLAFFGGLYYRIKTIKH